MADRIRVVLRGASGLLGSRLMACLEPAQDIQLTAIVVRNDPTLDRLISRLEFGGPRALALPNNVFLDDSPKTVRRLNGAQSRIQFRPIEELNLNEYCDVVIDAAATASTRNHPLLNQYNSFNGSIILQDGEYPTGRLIAPPLAAVNQGGNRYRQGGCFVSGMTPLLAAFKDELKSVKLHLVMQSDSREADFLIAERLNTFQVADHYIPRMEEEFGVLLPGVEVEVLGVIQIPGMLHYAASIEMEISGSWTHADVISALQPKPRIVVLPDQIVGSYDLNLARGLDGQIAPVAILGGTVKVAKHSTHTRIKMVAALYYRTLAVLPNIDSVRILARKMEPEIAMAITDRDMGFVK